MERAKIRVYIPMCGEVSLFSVYMVNVMKLNGEAVFLSVEYNLWIFSFHYIFSIYGAKRVSLLVLNQIRH
jgi:hypothetical protein